MSASGQSRHIQRTPKTIFVRYAPNSAHTTAEFVCQLSAISGLMHRLKIPLISDEAINIGKSWLFEEELTELFHERPQAILPHGRDEWIMQATLAEQRMDTSLGCAGL